MLYVLAQDGKRAHAHRHPPSALGAEVAAAFTSAAQNSTDILAAQKSAHYSSHYVQEKVLGHGRTGRAVLLRCVATGEHVVAKQIGLVADDREVQRVQQEVCVSC